MCRGDGTREAGCASTGRVGTDWGEPHDEEVGMSTKEDEPIKKITDVKDPYEGSAPKQETDQQKQQRESREAKG